ncbi:MAG: lipase [Alphaproteobacteria bacterium]|nr:lipase [Alphaproteobacteria bacterium]
MTALRICFVGDSIINGTADIDYLGWAGRACAAERARKHDVTLYNLGIRAETTAQILPRWRQECAPRLPDHSRGALVFSFGVNDMAEQDGSIRCPLRESVANAREMIAAARQWKPVLWVGPTPVDEAQQPFRPAPDISYSFHNGRTAELTEVYADVARELEVPFLDLFTALVGEPLYLGSLKAGDGVHPTAAGYSVIAERVDQWPAWRAWFDAEANS